MAFEHFPTDLLKYIRQYIHPVNDFVAYSSLNRRLHTLFKDERKKFMPVENLVCLYNSSFLLTPHGNLYACGRNTHGELGTGPEEAESDWKQSGPLGKKIFEIKGTSNIFVKCRDGWYSCGWNKNGNLGTGDDEDKYQWIKIGPVGKEVLELRDAWRMTFVRCSDGWYACGSNSLGQLGAGDNEKRVDWTKIGPRHSPVLELKIHDTQTLVRCEDGWYATTVIREEDEQEWIFRRSEKQKISWVKIEPPTQCEDGETKINFLGKKILEQCVYDENTLSRCEDGWYATGRNRFGQLGVGNTQERKDWVKFGPVDKEIFQISRSQWSFFVRCDDGWYVAGENYEHHHGMGVKGKVRCNWVKVFNLPEIKRDAASQISSDELLRLRMQSSAPIVSEPEENKGYCRVM